MVRLVSGLIGLAFALAVAFLLVGTVGFLGPMRAALVEKMLTSSLGAPVAIDGPVKFGLGPTVLITGSKIRVERPEGAPSGEADRIEEGAIGVGLRALLAGALDLRSLRLHGVALAENSTLVGFDPDAAAGDRNVQRWFGLVPGAVRLAKHADIAVSDVTYRYRDSRSGWDFDIVATTFATARGQSGGPSTITASGTVNGAALSVDASIRPLVFDGRAIGDGFTLTARTAGGTLEMRSVVPKDPAKDMRQASIGADISSVGDILDSLKIARTIEGTAKLAAGIETSGADSALRNLDASLTLADGATLRATGSIANLDAQKGFDLSIDAEWPTDGAKTVDEAGLLTFEVYGVTGRLTGDLDALALSEGWITTNLFSEAIPRLGPITAGAIRRDDDGRLAVEDLHVLAGPADAPTFDLSGRIGDLLQLADFDLSGDIAVPTADALGIKPADPAALGKLTGTFAVSDASGTAGVDTLTAKLTGSKLVSADLELKADQTKPEETARFALSLNVPDYARLASAAGLTSEPVGPVAFKGIVSLSRRSGDVDGSLRFGRTEISGDLSVKPEDKRALVAGNITTPALHLVDARRLFEIVSDFRRSRETSMARKQPASTQRAVMHPRFDIAVNAGRIEGAASDVSSVTGHVLYEEGLVTARSFSLEFDRGRFDFDGHMNVREESRPFSAKGRIARWPIGDALQTFEIDLPIEGVLEAAFDVSSSGASARTAVREARGDLYMRIVDGTIGNRLIDLSGLVLPSWLFAPSARTGTSRIACFSAKLAFDPGLATLQSAIVETDDVIVRATGLIDFKDDTIDIEATPKARVDNLIPIVSPFAIRGPLSAPKVVIKGGVAGRAVAEALALPFNTLGTLLGVDRTGPKPRDLSGGC